VSATPDRISIRPLGPDDDVEALTGLLHRSYAALGAMGLNYTAVDQTSQVTRRRIAGGVCLLAVSADGRVVGTALFKAPGLERGSPWLQRPEVAHVGQFAVEPALRKRGIGGRLMDVVEDMARAAGARELALDTRRARPPSHRFVFPPRLSLHRIRPLARQALSQRDHEQDAVI